MRDRAWRRFQTQRVAKRRFELYTELYPNAEVREGQFKDNHWGCGCKMCKPWKYWPHYSKFRKRW